MRYYFSQVAGNHHWHCIREFLTCLLIASTSLCASIQAECESDRDCDGLLDSEEDAIAIGCLPSIWAGKGEGCGPGWSDAHVCLDGAPYGKHQFEYVGYDVVALGFKDLFAIEYTIFLDFNRKTTLFYDDIHFYDNEGFTVLVQKTYGDVCSYGIVSVQTCGHEGRYYETWDRMYPHEIDSLWHLGLLMAEGTHAIYVHHGVCEGACDSYESCGQPWGPESKLVLSRSGTDSSYVGPYDLTMCSGSDLQNLDCWAGRLARTGNREWAYDWGDCVPFDRTPDPNAEWVMSTRKQFPPWVPPGIILPNNIAFVDLFRGKDFTGVSDEESIGDFGQSLVSSGMPLRIIQLTDSDWWRYMFDPGFQAELPNDKTGLWRGLFYYNYRNGWRHLWYANEVRSFKLHGLPGTVMALYDGVDYPGADRRIFSIADGARAYEIADMSQLDFGGVDFVSWGFGPTADAGNSRHVVCGDSITLDGRGSYQFAPDTATLRSVFGLDLSAHDSRDSAFRVLWTFEWFDETNSQFLGKGPVVSVRLSCGNHRIRLKVSGRRYPYPDNPSYCYDAVVNDWCTIDVDLVGPKQVGVVELCEGIELFWDTTGCGFGYRVLRDGNLLADIGPGMYYIDSTNGAHEYAVYSYDEFRRSCGSQMVSAATKNCVENGSELSSTFALDQNFPNPFNPGTAIDYSIREQSRVVIEVFNLLGQKVRSLEDRQQPAGSYTVHWNGADDAGLPVSSGVYLYRIQAGNFVETKKMLLIR